MFLGSATEGGRLTLNVSNTFQHQSGYKEPQGKNVLPACLTLLLVSASAFASKRLCWHQRPAPLAFQHGLKTVSIEVFQTFGVRLELLRHSFRLRTTQVVE